ncbi:TPA: hypothetical protein HGS53_23030 [Escherichia coli]|jgi:hypothetical protein|nr:hypothetical protein [Escherichia coli]KYT16398.1 hypothetical protein AML44_08350 [Escherichia coli]KYV14636.1 hypothetical protein AML36_23235 [Escherichia coli]QDN18447.1 hypothetical protein FNJ72_27275 [Escherichia coli]RRO68182.1 hypothetical protein AWE53_027425 [Escherichia coli]
MGERCYQSIVSVDTFTDFIVKAQADGMLNECNLRENDRYARLLRTYLFRSMAVIHAVIDLRAGIVHLIVYSLVTNEITEFEAEYFICQIRQNLDRY